LALSTPMFILLCSIAERVDCGMPVIEDNSF